jgi:uncharacterized lipoprotein YddW (UPF0748 family)
MHHLRTVLVFLLLSTALTAQVPAKREFRATWIHTVGQTKYASMSQEQMKTYFTGLLDTLQKAGINVVIFQVRPEADAWYRSKLEPWSRYITGEQGKDPGWDPLEYLISECHSRNMELHAWLNPYRARTSLSKPFAANHIYNRHPDWFIPYGDLTWFDPGNPECRIFIKNVVRDIVKRYDIDAIHMDDYFYPYPAGGKDFGDAKSFRTYGFAMGFLPDQKADWRRENVNLLIRDLHQLIHDCKPWVQFGVSPFGIWRNQKTDPKGSNTNGLTNYDGLYADVLTWVKNGWVDYNIPQLYWEIGHKNADYTTLLNWWADNNFGKPLYIGQDVLRTIKPDSLRRNQLYRKMMLAAGRIEISGHCFWPGYELERNAGGICDSLRNTYFKYPALLPANNTNDQIPPKPVFDLRIRKASNGSTQLFWKTEADTAFTDKAFQFVIYRFRKMEEINLDDPRCIVGISNSNTYDIPAWCKGKQVFIVTALDRCHNESTPKTLEVD